MYLIRVLVIFIGIGGLLYNRLGRIEGFPSRYSPKHWPVTIDVTEIIFVTFFAIIGITYLCIVPGYSKKRTIYVVIKATLSILIGCLLIVENFGQEWEVGSVKTKTPYRAGQKHEIEASIGLKIGLRSVNITLQAKPEEGTVLAKETINYNERFWWTWDQGRFGFGPYEKLLKIGMNFPYKQYYDYKRLPYNAVNILCCAKWCNVVLPFFFNHSGLLQRSFRDAQRKGLPIPILSVTEYFTIDGEGIRFGRFYRTAGWYCHILLWTAFACWTLANIFLQSVGRYAAYLIGTMGGLQLLTCIVWLIVHNPTPLVIPFENGVIRLYFGLHYWMTLFCGMLCVFLALLIIYMDLRYPNALSTFLGIDPLKEYDESLMRCSEIENIMRNKRNDRPGMEMRSMSNNVQTSTKDAVVVFKRRSTIRNAQKSLYRPPVPVKIDNSTEEGIYENQDVIPSHSSGPKVNAHKPPVPKKTRRIRVTP